MGLSISRRLWLMVAAAAIALLTVASISLYVSGQLASALDAANKNSIPSIGLADDVEITLLRIRLAATQFITAADTDHRSAAEQRINASLGAMLDKMQKYDREYVASNEERTLFERASSDVKSYHSTLSRILDLTRNGSSDQARQVFYSELVSVGDAAYDSLEKLASFNENEAAELAAQAEGTEKAGNVLSIVSSLIALAIVAGLGFWVISNLSRVLNDVRGAVLHIRNNLDFTKRIEVTNRDELGEAAEALNDLFGTMQGNLRKIAESTSSVAKAAGLLATTSGQVASASHSQSSAASAMAAAVEEMTVSITHVGDRASEANTLASESGKLAESGVKVINRTVEEIGQIAQSVDGASQRIRELDQQTDHISSVVKVITDIADQTNLLALNAAIEAARAGEQGRGFAVVADEVRKLAERTAQSTHEIANMINTVRTGAQNAVAGMDEAVSNVRSGVERANEANIAISQIGESSRRAVGMVSEITDAIREQSSTSTNIAQQIERIAQMAEESSASATASADAAHELDKAAESMQRIVSSYRL